MDAWLAVLGLVAVVVPALVAYLPPVSRDDRRRSRIASDQELLESLREGEAKERLHETVERDLLKMLGERDKIRRPAERPMRMFFGSSSAAIFLLLVQASLHDSTVIVTFLSNALVFLALIAILFMVTSGFQWAWSASEAVLLGVRIAWLDFQTRRTR